jgi:hypothetical protein
MPSRAYIAHDRVVSAARMYMQMAFIGLLLALIVYAGAMGFYLSRYISGPIPELQIAGGQPTLKVYPNSPRLRITSLFKYYVSFNPKNYLNLQLSFSSKKSGEKQEPVEPELQILLKKHVAPRETYRKAILLVTQGRVEKLRWIMPISLLFFPIFGLLYFFSFSRLNKRSEKTQFAGAALSGRSIIARCRFPPAHPATWYLGNWKISLPKPFFENAQRAARFRRRSEQMHHLRC